MNTDAAIQLFESYLQLSRKQSEVINSPDLVMEIMNEKQSIIEKINSLECKYSDSRIKQLVSEAVILEQKNILALKEQQEIVFNKLQSLKRNKRVLAYQGNVFNTEGILTDHKR